MMIAQLIRPIWEWALWSRRRLILTVCVVALLVVVAGRFVRATQNQQPPHLMPSAAARPSAPSAHSTAPAPSGQSAGPAPNGSDLAAAILAGERFAAAWVSHAPGWQAQARKYATPALAAALRRPAHTRWHTAAVTGPAAAAGESAGSVTITVPTTAGVALITVVRSASGWLSSAARYAAQGH